MHLAEAFESCLDLVGVGNVGDGGPYLDPVLAEQADEFVHPVAQVKGRNGGALRAKEAAEPLADAAGGSRDGYRFAGKLSAHEVPRKASPIQARLARRRWPQL